MSKIAGIILGIFGILIFIRPLSNQDSKPYDFPQVQTPPKSSLPYANDLDELLARGHKFYQEGEGYDFSLAITGDVMLGRQVNVNISKSTDTLWPFTNIKSHLEEADLAIINLENPLTDPCPPKTDGMIFCGAISSASLLKRGGVDLVNLANNHTLNHGQLGLDQTKKALTAVGVSYFGDGQLTLATVSGQTLGFLGFTDLAGGPSFLAGDLNRLKHEITAAAPQVDFLSVAFHFGNEYEDHANARQQLLSQTAIDAGADLIIGHHPHHLQPPLYYKNRLILPSMGNFIFDQMWSEKTRQGALAYAYFQENKLVGLYLLPTYITEYGLVSPADFNLFD